MIFVMMAAETGYHGIVSNEDGDEWLTGQTGCPQLVEGYNRPMLFDGSSDYVQVASDGRAFGNQSFTISAWVNMPDVTPSGQDRVIFSYDYTAHSQPYYAMQPSGCCHLWCTRVLLE